jgi:hypothetical protein
VVRRVSLSSLENSSFGLLFSGHKGLMPPIWWNHPFVSDRRIIDDIEDFLEVFIGRLSYHRVLQFSADFSSFGQSQAAPKL